MSASPQSARSALTVLLVGNYEYDRQESMQRFAKVLAEELPKYGVRVKKSGPAPCFGKLRSSSSGIGKWLGYIDKFLIFPFRLRRQIDRTRRQCAANGDKFVVHICDHSNAVYTRYLNGIPHVVTCNDMLAIRSARGEIAQNVTRWSGQILQRMILHGLNQAQAIACISKATLQDLLRISTLSRDQARVIYMGLNHPYFPLTRTVAQVQVRKCLAARERPSLPATEISYILHVGGNPWYKNRLGVLRIYAALREELARSGDGVIPKLFMVGQSPSPEMNAFLACQDGLVAEVRFLQGISNEELRALYSGAELLLFPSFEEGFGWPIIEAQACGCQVVTSGKAPMTEVGGEAAVYLDPMAVDGTAPGAFERAAAVIAQVLAEDEEMRQWRIAQGVENARRFSTAEMIQQYLEAYQGLVSEVRVSASAP